MNIEHKYYYYRVEDKNGEVIYLKSSHEPKSKERLLELLHIEGTITEITKEEYEEDTDGD